MINLKRSKLFSLTACDIVCVERSVSKFEVFFFTWSAPSTLYPHSSHTALHGAFHHLDRNLALDGFIHLLMHKVISVIIFFPENFEGGEHKCVLMGE